MAITVDATSSGRATAGGITISHTTGTLTNGAMYVMTGVQDSNHANFPVTGITYGGVSFTKVRSDEATGNVGTEIWRLLNPAAGTADVVVSTTGALGETAAIVITLSNVDQTTPTEANAGTSGSSSSPSQSITTLTNGAYILAMCTAESTFSGSGTDQTVIATLTGQSYENSRGSYEAKATAGADTQSFTLSSGQPWAISTAAVKPATSGTSTNSSRDAKITGTSSEALAISTVGTADLGKTTVSFIGSITAVAGYTVTRRGFQYNTTAYPDKEVYEDGDFGAEQYGLAVTGLSAGTTYYFRAFATDTNSTEYGNWESFTTPTSTYSILINGEDRTGDILNQTIAIEDAVNDLQNTISFVLVDLSALGIPDPDEEIIITLEDGTIIFGGYTTEINIDKRGGTVMATIRGIDYVRLLDRKLVHKTYENQTDKQIIEDIIVSYCTGITTTAVLEGVTIDQISFNYIQPSQALRKIAELTGRNWYIDYTKDIHYFPLATETAPFDITSSTSNYKNLRISKDATQIKNRVYVRGGTKLSDPTTYSVKGDGVSKQFVLPDKPHNVSVTVNGASKTLGIKNIDTSGYDWYLNFQEKYVEQDVGGATLATTDTLAVTYEYDIPILVAVENTASIAEHGQHEFAVFDKQITTTQAARDRAGAELTDYANNVIEGNFETYTAGFKSGQYINITLTNYDVAANYIIQRVNARSLGSGLFVYDVSVASVKTMGIIKFLIQLLEANRNIITLDDNEVVDELFNVTDLLISDSLLDSLTIDSAGQYRTWCTDSLQSTPTTRAIWNLFEWGT